MNSKLVALNFTAGRGWCTPFATPSLRMMRKRNLRRVLRWPRGSHHAYECMLFSYIFCAIAQLFVVPIYRCAVGHTVPISFAHSACHTGTSTLIRRALVV